MSVDAREIPLFIVIAIIVCAVIAVSAAIVVLLWRSTERARHKWSPDLFYFYDFDKELQCMDLRIYERRNENSCSGEILISEEKPQDSLIVSFNGSGQQKGSFDVSKTNSDQKIESDPFFAVEHDLHNRKDFIACLAHFVKDDFPETLAVGRIDTAGVMCELDLETFLLPGFRDQSMISTAYVPCALMRHFDFIPPPPLILDRSGKNVLEPPGKHTVTIANSQQRTDNQLEDTGVIFNQGGLKSIECEETSAVNNSVSKYSSSGRSFHRASSNGSIPFPLILPQGSLIDTTTPIFVSVTRYISTETQEEISPTIAERLEYAFCSNAVGHIKLGRGITAELNRASDSGELFIRKADGTLSKLNFKRVLFRDFEEFSIEYSTDADSYPYEPYIAPFCLHLGKWCVKVRVVDKVTQEVRSQSRVFSVGASEDDGD